MLRSSRWVAVPWAWAMLVLAGCAAAPVVAPGPGRTADPDELTQWVAKGRIALVAQGEGGAGSFVWQQRSERTQLAVRGPLGAGGLNVMTDGEALQVDDGSGQPIDGEAARIAIEQRLGADLPLAQIRYWMLGVPAPDSLGPAQRATGSVHGFTQAGWVVEYEGYRQSGEWSLPARLTATTANARLRLVIDDWQLSPTP
jgi:outer membrane lipoprotein LolB